MEQSIKEMNPKARRIYEDNVIDDRDVVDEISRVAAKLIFEKFKMNFTVQPRYLTVVFILIWDTLVSEVTAQEKTNSKFSLNICNRFVVGFDDRCDEDDEKQGNFVPFVTHISVGNGNDEFVDDATTAQERFVQYNTENITSDLDVIREIASKSAKRITSEADIIIATPEAIIPILVTVYDAVVSTVKMARTEEKDRWRYSINFASCFDITAQQSDKDNLHDKISIKPSISHKIETKSDVSHADLE